jgi:hypothetical protein
MAEKASSDLLAGLPPLLSSDGLNTVLQRILAHMAAQVRTNSCALSNIP